MVGRSRRDPAREARLRPEAKTLLDEYLDAISKTVRVGRVRWDVLYSAMETEDPVEWDEVETEAREAIANFRQRAIDKARWAREEVEEQAWESRAEEVEWWRSSPDMARRYRGKDVWLYHGTSSVFLDKILKEGLHPIPRGGEKTFGDSSPYVFLTAAVGSGLFGQAASVSWYAERAVAVHGGDPVVLRLIVPFDELDWDPDDADLGTGKAQFIYLGGSIPPSWIREVDSEKIEP